MMPSVKRKEKLGIRMKIKIAQITILNHVVAVTLNIQEDVLI
jgi:hypothetical protein